VKNLEMAVREIESSVICGGDIGKHVR